MNKQNYEALLSVFDRLYVGLCITLDSGVVLIRNAEAERILSQCGGIRLTRDNRLKCLDAASQQLIEQALERACSDIERQDNAQELLVLPEPEGDGLTVLVEVAPLYVNGEDTESHLHSALVTLIDTSVSRELSVDRTAVAYNLTAAETHICQLLVEGKTTHAIARHRQVSSPLCQGTCPVN